MTPERLAARETDTRGQTLMIALRAACTYCAENGAPGVVAVYLAGARVLDVIYQPLLARASQASAGRVPRDADHAVMIVVTGASDETCAALAHLDVLVGQIRERLSVDAEICVRRLKPGERWIDLLDDDNPGGAIPCPPAEPQAGSRPPGVLASRFETVRGRCA